MSYFPSDISFMSEEELKANGIRIPKSKDERAGTEQGRREREMSNAELKPCPFCGGEAEVHKHYPPFGRRVIVTVRCTKCRSNSGNWGRTDKAIESWNRRMTE